MNFRIIDRRQINTEWWDNLVKSNVSHTVYNLSSYLDSVSENWCILTNKNHTGGIALPYKIKLGIKFCYTPFFVSFLEWMGTEPSNWNECLELIHREFKSFHLFVKQGFNTEKINIYQTIPADKIPQINSQAIRMLKKFEQSGMSISFTKSPEQIIDIIQTELPRKVRSLNTNSLKRLAHLVDQFNQLELAHFVTVKNNEKVVGGLILIQFNETILYLKGAFYPEAKKKGAMYASMQYSIDFAQANNLNFDFGGSQVEGVRRFNLNLGGTDLYYNTLTWDNSPVWFRLAKKINTFIRLS